MTREKVIAGKLAQQRLFFFDKTKECFIMNKSTAEYLIPCFEGFLYVKQPVGTEGGRGRCSVFRTVGWGPDFVDEFLWMNSRVATFHINKHPYLSNHCPRSCCEIPLDFAVYQSY